MFPATNHHLKRSSILLSIAVLPLAVWLLWNSMLSLNFKPIAVTGTLQAKEIPVASKVGGRIAAVRVLEGQMVRAGQVLVEFETPELEAKRRQLIAGIKEATSRLEELRNGPRLAEIEKARATASHAYANWQMLKRGFRKEDVEKAESQRKEAEANLLLLKNGYRQEEIVQAKEAVEQAKVQLDWSQREWQRYRKLAQQGAVSQRDAEDLKAKMDIASQGLQASEANYRKMLKGPRLEEILAAEQRHNFARRQEDLMRRGPRLEEIEMARQQYIQAKEALRLLEQGTRYEQIAQAEARLQLSQSQLEELDAQLKDKYVKAPVDSEVSVMDLHAGEIIAANKPLATLTRLDDLWTRVYIPERELSRIRIGQNVAVKVDAYPKRLFGGTIVQIPGVAEFTPRNIQTPEERSAQVFALKVRVKNPDLTLRGGMNAEVTLPPVEGPLARLAQHK